MPKPDPIETILARLMPPAMSEAAQRDIEDMLDELADTTPQGVVSAPAIMAWQRRWIIGGSAAAAVALAWILPLATTSVRSSRAALAPATAESNEFVLMGESDRIESMRDEGWQENADGSTMRAMRLNVVAENSLLDRETGIVMQVSEPREELFLMPVSTF